MKLRKHQAEFLDVCTDIRLDRAITKVIVSATPGGGKSLIPVIAAAKLLPAVADKICWIVPRLALQEQGERAFMDPFFREQLGHKHQLRASANEQNPGRGCSGYVTTYQAVSQNPQLHAQEFTKNKYILVLDEPHHVEAEGVWHLALRPLVERAAVSILMSGTFERSSGNRIAFMPYSESVAGAEPDLFDGPDTRVIEYSRADALRDRAIIPMHFQYVDGRARWIGRDGQEHEIESLAEAGREANAAIFTALHTDYAYQLLSSCIDHWRHYKTFNPRSKMLVVAPSIEKAKDYALKLIEMGVSCEVATSDEGQKAEKAIKDFKRHDGERVDVLVTVAMAYEGLDVPAITHIACLTHIRSRPWIEQMVARACRVDSPAGPYESLYGYVFCPDDPLLHYCINKIQEEQYPFLKMKGQTEQVERAPSVPGVERMMALESEATRSRGRDLGEMGGLDYEENQMYLNFMKENGIGGSPVQLKQQMTARIESGVTEEDLQETLTPREQEQYLRKQIEAYCRRYQSKKSLGHGFLNKEIVRQFQKSRREMTMVELVKAMAWLNRYYPM
ncbi:MAG: DEAD/DEAH box helicase family protein [bacterium]|nr:DEAD/DEAH box helicase family protein [bacterium]